MVGVYGLVHDITKLKRVETELRLLAQHDALTGLANRRRFEEQLAQAMAHSDRKGSPMALLFIDIDRFKLINDRLGHRAGDLVLKEFARRLAACVRKTDMAARLAGDEFVVILEPLDRAGDASVVAQKIVDALVEPMAVEGQSLSVSASIGIALRPPFEHDGVALLRRADKALYAAKATSDCRYQVAD